MKKADSEKIIDWYNQHAPEYAQAIKELISFDQIKDFVSLLPEKAQIFDAGCGGGRDSAIFHQWGYKTFGLDLSIGMLREAKKQNDFQGFTNADHLALPTTSESVDGVWAHASLHHLKSHEVFEKAVSEFHRVLRSGGILHLATQAQTGESDSAVVLDTLSHGERHYIYFTEERLRELLARTHFELIKLDQFGETERKVNAGRTNVEWLVTLARKA